MKFKFETGNTKFKITIDDKAIFKINPAFFSRYLDYYKKDPSSSAPEASPAGSSEGYTAGSSKGFSRLIHATGHDIYNYVARYGTGNFQLQPVLLLKDKLDYSRLEKSVMLSVMAEPILGCRFVEAETPFWKPLENIDKVDFCSLEETSDSEGSIKRYLDSSLDMDNDPMVKIRLVRSEKSDVLIIKLNHACCDGGGVKDYIQLLSDIYTRLGDGDGTYLPMPHERTRRDQDCLFSSLGIADPEMAWIPGSEISTPTWPFPWKLCGSPSARTVVFRLPDEQLTGLEDYSSNSGCTINDLMLTAFYRAMARIGYASYGSPMEIPVTVDLRRYLPEGKTEAIRNFSGSVNTRIIMAEGDTFDDTLSKVTEVMSDIKSEYPGLQSAIGLERLEKLSFCETLAYFQVPPKEKQDAATSLYYCGDKCLPTLSNLGYISKTPILFGDIEVQEIYVVPPVVKAPGLLLMVSTYKRVITLTAGYFEASVSRVDVERLLGLIRDELAEACK